MNGSIVSAYNLKLKKPERMIVESRKSMPNGAILLQGTGQDSGMKLAKIVSGKK